jgi:hypothetical protein
MPPSQAHELIPNPQHPRTRTSSKNAQVSGLFLKHGPCLTLRTPALLTSRLLSLSCPSCGRAPVTTAIASPGSDSPFKYRTAAAGPALSVTFPVRICTSWRLCSSWRRLPGSCTLRATSREAATAPRDDRRRVRPSGSARYRSSTWEGRGWIWQNATFLHFLDRLRSTICKSSRRTSVRLTGTNNMCSRLKDDYACCATLSNLMPKACTKASKQLGEKTLVSAMQSGNYSGFAWNSGCQWLIGSKQLQEEVLETAHSSRIRKRSVLKASQAIGPHPGSFELRACTSCVRELGRRIHLDHDLKLPAGS